MIVGEAAMDERGNITIKNYADTEFVLPFFDESETPRDMTAFAVKMVVEGAADIFATPTGFPHIKKITIPAVYASGFDENKPRQYAIVDMSAGGAGQEIISGSIRAKKIG